MFYIAVGVDLWAMAALLQYNKALHLLKEKSTRGLRCDANRNLITDSKKVTSVEF